MTISNTLLQEPSSSNEPGELPARLLAIATLQILANSTQFTSVRPLSLSTLTDVAAGYLELIAQAARNTADHSGRTQINGWDLSTVLENLEGPGAISGLQNWCIDNLTTTTSHQSQKQPVEKLVKLAKNLKEFTHTPSIEPITTLSFLPLTDAEILELDRAGESDLEEQDHPSPSYSSSDSSQQDSDLPPDPHSNKNLTTSTTTTTTQPTTLHQISPWRSIEDIPAYVPAHFPPFPGLERASGSSQTDPPPIDHPNPIPTSPTIEPLDQQLNPSINLNPYLVAIPFSKSQLAESHGPSFLEPQAPIHSTPSFVDQVHRSKEKEEEEEAEKSPSRKKTKRSNSMDGFLQTYAYMVEEKKTMTMNNNNNKGGAEEAKFMKRNPVRHRFIAGEQTMAVHDSLIGTIPVSPIRTNRWSAGWIPHPPSQDGRLLPVPELKPFGHTPLPAPVTMPVPIQFPACPPFHQPYPRIPDLIPRLFQRIGQQARAERFTLVSRMTRLGPPSELGEAGEPLPYRIKDLNKIDPPSQNNTSSTSAQQPKYIEWGFHWPPHEGRDPLPQPKPLLPDSFKPPEFPGMPKTTAEKLRIVQREKELLAGTHVALNPSSQLVNLPPPPTAAPSGSGPIIEDVI
ncbi:hypothetical protein PGTUg99_028433 [Puccinia graminis f. sp. tritici]|uniref:Bromodomain associated domain-containing protein n=1 Tax=Puccinia graminis f. sp. tritici TaxID=56615 RepID=A0A5B0S6F5_PUCGR|nr:hypothetical protein PGTUg99_028433 [Puccinia graminis f. sp. tritici]